MFSFIKYIQELKERLQRNKGLWFTTITVISIIGIVTTMYIIMSMTNNVSEKVYKSMSNEYVIRITNFFDERKKEFQKIAITTVQNKAFLEQVEQNNEEALTTSLSALNDLFAKNGVVNYKVSAFSIANKEAILRPSVVSVIQSKNSVYGIEVMSDGVFNTYLQPLIKEDAVYGVLEVKESIHNYRKYFEGLNDEYVFLLDKKMLPKLSVEVKNGLYRDMTEELTVAQTFYDTKFTASIPDISEKDFEKLINDKYLIDGVYYRTYRVITDTNGANIGMIITGEQIDREDGFVNLADNMTKTITTVALGLVISIMLFMF